MVTIFLFILNFSSAQGQVIKLSPQQVVDQVMFNSLRGKELKLNHELARLAYITQLQTFDWIFNVESGNENSNFEPQNGLNFSSGQRSMQSKLGVQKNWISGTQMSFDVNHNSTEFDLVAGSFLPPVVNVWSSNLTITQSLWRNYFGASARNELLAQLKIYENAELQKIEDLENLIVESLTRYWQVVTTKSAYLEAIQTRNRYKTLLGNVKRKQAVGYANPGELAQVQAELEAKEQSILRSDLAYQQVKQDFITFLNFEKKPDDLDLEIPLKAIAPPNKLNALPSEALRPIRIAQQKVDAAWSRVLATQANQGAEVALIGQFGIAGVDKDSAIAREEWLNAERPRVFTGIRVQWELGSDYRKEQAINRRLSYDQELLRLTRFKKELEDQYNHLERRLVNNYELTQSLQRQKVFRNKAVDELTRNYQLGRIEIRTLIESINAAFGTEMEFLKSVGDYQITLTEVAAFRDELIK